VFFAQEHRPGELCQSDFRHCRELGVTINGQPFPHFIYHFVLSYSSWETGSICYSETFESLSEGLQNALWQLGGVPSEHRTDRMSAAVNNLCNAKEFTRAYEGLLRHTGSVVECRPKRKISRRSGTTSAASEQRLDSVRRERVRVSPGSLVTVHRNIYSVHSRLIGEMSAQ
jgi:hypothetical protein